MNFVSQETNLLPLARVYVWLGILATPNLCNFTRTVLTALPAYGWNRSLHKLGPGSHMKAGPRIFRSAPKS